MGVANLGAREVMTFRDGRGPSIQHWGPIAEGPMLDRREIDISRHVSAVDGT